MSGTTPMTGNAMITMTPLPLQPEISQFHLLRLPETSGVIYTVPLDPSVTYTWSYSGTGATINGSGNSVQSFL